MDLKEEEKKATCLLKGKKVDRIFRNKKKEVCIKFDDGTRFFVHVSEDGLELSIT